MYMILLSMNLLYYISKVVIVYNLTSFTLNKNTMVEMMVAYHTVNKMANF